MTIFCGYSSLCVRGKNDPSNFKLRMQNLWPYITRPWVQSYDEAAIEDEALLLVTPCVRAVVSLAGVTLGKRRQN